MLEKLRVIVEFAPLALPLASIVAYVIFKKQVTQQRLKNSFEFSKEFSQKKEIQDALDTYIKLKSNRFEVPLEHWAKKANRMTKQARCLRILANELERMGAGIRYEIYDESFLFNSHGSSVVRIHRDLGPYLTELKKDNPLIFKEFDYISARWRARHKKPL